MMRVPPVTMKLQMMKSYRVIGRRSSMKCMSFVKRFRILEHNVAPCIQNERRGAGFSDAK